MVTSCITLLWFMMILNYHSINNEVNYSILSVYSLKNEVVKLENKKGPFSYLYQWVGKNNKVVIKKWDS